MTIRDFVVKNGLDVTEDAIIRDTTDSTSKDTGALIVEGGVGIERNLTVGANLTVDGTTTLTGNATLTGDIAVNGGDLTTNQTTFNLLNTTATTLNFGGAATTLNLGATTGTTNVRNNLNVTGDLDIDGGDLTVSTSSFNLANTTATTLNIGGAATSLNLGASTGTLTVNNLQTVFNSTGTVQIPVGTTAQRGGSPTQGQIRYNSQLSLFEGYGAGNQWNSLGGVRDVDGDTYILAELTPASDNDTLYFYTGGTNSLSLTSSVLDVKAGTTLSVANTTEASSSTTGAVQIAGGLGVAGRIYAGSIQNTPIGTSVRNTALFTTLGVNGQVTFNAGTASTTTGTGSLVVTGGIGLSGAINAGASSTFAGLSSTSTTTLSPANASVTISPTGTGTVTIAPATTGSINNVNIGATTAGTGAFTTLTASSTVTLSPANASVTVSPTGTGTVTLNPATAGTINNMSIGATTASTGRFTTVTSTVATGTAPFTVASTTAVTNLNADLLDGFNSATASTVSTVAVRDSSGDINVRLVRSEFANQATISGAMAFRINNSTDNYVRFCSDTGAIRTFLDVPTRSGTNATGTWAISISGNADTATNLVNDAPFLRSRGTIAEGSLNSATSNGFYTVSKTGYSSSLLTWNASGSTGPVQIDVDYNDIIRYRNQTDSVTWNNWKTLLHSSNFNTYAPTLAGVGATGTWGINISGSAATLTTARTITIGSTARTFNGSANISWTADQIGVTADYVLPNTAGATGWIRLGTWATGQSGQQLTIRITAGTGYNANTAQNRITEIHIKTSNGSSSQPGAAGGTVLADGHMRSFGTGNTPSVVRLVQLSTSSYEVWGNFGSFTGSSFYEVAHGGTSWTHSGTNNGATAPTGTYIDLINLATLDSSGNYNINGTFTEASSIRYKENIRPIDNSLEKILQLNGVIYDKKNKSSLNEPGLIAEDVEKVIPELVQLNEIGEAEGIHYTKITAYLIECIKELNAKIEKLEGKK